MNFQDLSKACEYYERKGFAFFNFPVGTTDLYKKLGTFNLDFGKHYFIEPVVSQEVLKHYIYKVNIFDYFEYSTPEEVEIRFIVLANEAFIFYQNFFNKPPKVINDGLTHRFYIDNREIAVFQKIVLDNKAVVCGTGFELNFSMP